MLRLLLTSVLIYALIPTSPAQADTVYPIIFPVVGENHYSDTFGAPRGDHTHEGTDIMAAKMTPVVAAASGTVGWVSSTCCAMELIHDDGFRSRYIHLNNDTEGTDDGLGWGFAPGIESGTRVEAGELIGWVGDSGNAEWTAPHLHFELRDPDGVAFNSYPSLLVATPPDVTETSWAVGVHASGSMEELSPTISLPVNAFSAAAVIGDFDGDGDSEAAVGGNPAGGLMISELDGTTSTWAPSFVTSAAAALVGDFDGDGDDDIAAMSDSGEWTGYRSTRETFESEPWGRHSGSPWEHFRVGDFDGDGADELVAFHPPSKRWWMSDLVGSGWRHSVFARYGTRSGWLVHLSGDTDADGRDELLSFHPSNGTWWSTGYGATPSLVVNFKTNSGWLHQTVLDVDSDAVDEIVQYHPSNGTWWMVDPSTGAQVSLWARFNTRHGWEHPIELASDTLAVRHTSSGNIWSIAGPTGTLDFVGRLLPGRLESLWAGSFDGSPAVIGLQRD